MVVLQGRLLGAFKSLQQDSAVLFLVPFQRFGIDVGAIAFARVTVAGRHLRKIHKMLVLWREAKMGGGTAILWLVAHQLYEGGTMTMTL